MVIGRKRGSATRSAESHFQKAPHIPHSGLEERVCDLQTHLDLVTCSQFLEGIEMVEKVFIPIIASAP